MYFSCKQTFTKAKGNPLSSPLPFIAICCLDQWLQACMTSLAWDCCLLLTVVPLNTSCMFCSCSLMHTTTIQWTGLLDWTIALTKTASEWRLNRTVKLKHSDYILDYTIHAAKPDCKQTTSLCWTPAWLCKTWVIKHNLISILMGVVPFMWPSSCCSMQPGTKTI